MRRALFLFWISIGWPIWATDNSTDGGAVLSFAGYPDAPNFTVKPLKKKIRNCERCHGEMQHNTNIRVLEDAPHIDSLNHGNGRFWCLECHDEVESNKLQTPTGEKVGFADAYLVCGSCHANRQKDWYFGAHGKRVENWDGQRVILGCTNCHEPHEPTLQPYKPKAPPQLRVGLNPSAKKHQLPIIWPWQVINTSEANHE